MKRFVIWILPKRTTKGNISRFKNGLPHGKLVPEGTPDAIKVMLRQHIRKREFLKEPDDNPATQACARYQPNTWENAFGGTS